MEKDHSHFDADPSIPLEDKYLVTPENSAYLLDWDLSVGDPDYPTREDIQRLQNLTRARESYKQNSDIPIARFPESTPLMFPQVNLENEGE